MTKKSDRVHGYKVYELKCGMYIMHAFYGMRNINDKLKELGEESGAFIRQRRETS